MLTFTVRGNKMKIIINKYVQHLKGYLDAIDDINGSQREFYSTVDMISTASNDILHTLKFLSDNFTDLKIIKREVFSKSYGISHILEKLIFIRPFSGLYEEDCSSNIPNDCTEQYKKYAIFHIEDYIDFSLIEQFGKASVTPRTIEILLIENKKTILIAIVIHIDDIKIILRFYRNNFSKKEFEEWFGQIIRQKGAGDNDKKKEQ
jgi:hypothetical protein